jgi:hypothetical protein
MTMATPALVITGPFRVCWSGGGCANRLHWYVLQPTKGSLPLSALSSNKCTRVYRSCRWLWHVLDPGHDRPAAQRHGVVWYHPQSGGKRRGSSLCPVLCALCWVPCPGLSVVLAGDCCGLHPGVWCRVMMVCSVYWLSTALTEVRMPLRKEPLVVVVLVFSILKCRKSGVLSSKPFTSVNNEMETAVLCVVVCDCESRWVFCRILLSCGGGL